jgi:hypothetical protein
MPPCYSYCHIPPNAHFLQISMARRWSEICTVISVGLGSSAEHPSKMSVLVSVAKIPRLTVFGEDEEHGELN